MTTDTTWVSVPGMLGVEVNQDQELRLRFDGQDCTRLSVYINTCEHNTSYYGCVLDRWDKWQTPVGVIERHYWARGSGLERTGVEWRVVAVAEIKAAQERFETAGAEYESAKSALMRLVEEWKPLTE